MATQVGTPPTRASVWPFVPAEVVARRDEPLPRRSAFACMVPHPVPPFAAASIDEPTCVARSSAPLIVASVEVAAAYTLPTAFTARPPSESDERVSWFEATRLVVVALVAVALPVMVTLPEKVDDAETMIPRVDVGASAPFTILQSRSVVSAAVSDDDETLLLKVVQSSAVRQPKVAPFAVAQLNEVPS